MRRQRVFAFRHGQGTEHKAGVWVIPAGADLSPGTTVEPFVGLGPDADTVPTAELTRLLSARNGRLHGFLRDQHFVLLRA